MVENAGRTDTSAQPGREATLIERLAEKVGMRASTTTVYAEPVERGGIVVIPVARVRWGFGGGWGRRADGREGGGGGGGGVQVSPIGYIEVRDGQAEFRAIRDPAAIAPLVIAGAFAGWLFMRTVRRLFRG